MVAVIREGKGHEVALESVRRLRPSFPGLRLVIVGDGPARGGVEALAGELGDAVVMAGHRDDVMDVLDAVDVLVHPSRVDAFPTALLEAMAAGVPVVATSVGGIPEIVEDGRTGTLIGAPAQPERLGEALAELLGDEALRRSRGEAGRERFEREFSAERWAERLRAVYEDAIAARR
jgi:glycosyltransferase involved in cell wall biosynthesis